MKALLVAIKGVSTMCYGLRGGTCQDPQQSLKVFFIFLMYLCQSLYKFVYIFKCICNFVTIEKQQYLAKKQTSSHTYKYTFKERYCCDDRLFNLIRSANC